MLAHWYTLLLLPDDAPPATGPREVLRRASPITTQLARDSEIVLTAELASRIDLEDPT